MLCYSGTQWGPVLSPWAGDIGPLSGTERTTAAAAGGSELTRPPLPRSPCPPALCQGPMSHSWSQWSWSLSPGRSPGCWGTPGSSCPLGMLWHKAARLHPWGLPPRSPGLWGGEKPWGDPSRAACRCHLALLIFVTPVGSRLGLGSAAVPRADGAESVCGAAEHSRDTAPLHRAGGGPGTPGGTEDGNGPTGPGLVGSDTSTASVRPVPAAGSEAAPPASQTPRWAW